MYDELYWRVKGSWINGRRSSYECVWGKCKIRKESIGKIIRSGSLVRKGRVWWEN